MNKFHLLVLFLVVSLFTTHIYLAIKHLNVTNDTEELFNFSMNFK